MNSQVQPSARNPAAPPLANPAAAGVFGLPPLPYAEDALAPVISARTVQYHYGKHHRGYVDTLNKLVAGMPFAAMTLEEIVGATAGQAEYAPVYHTRLKRGTMRFTGAVCSPSAKARHRQRWQR